jgi:hypothetical protein
MIAQSLDIQSQATAELYSYLEQQAQEVTVARRAPAPTCSQCFHFRNGICQLKAAADWGDSSKVSPTRPACHFAEILPF